MLTGVDVQMEGIWQGPEFTLMKFDHALNVQVTLLDAVLFVRKVKCKPYVLLTHETECALSYINTLITKRV